MWSKAAEINIIQKRLRFAISSTGISSSRTISINKHWSWNTCFNIKFHHMQLLDFISKQTVNQSSNICSANKHYIKASEKILKWEQENNVLQKYT